MAEKRTLFTPIYSNEISTNIGLVVAVGAHKDGTGTPRDTLRVFGSYAIDLCLEGSADYIDANGVQQKVRPGDLITVFPELPHRYCTKPGYYWTECFMIFEGPVFDLCRTQGIIDAAHPIRHLEPVGEWHQKLLSIVQHPTSQSYVEKAAEVSRLLQFLMEVNPLKPDALHGMDDVPWLATSKGMLGLNLHAELDLRAVAYELGVSYETFRKRFQEQVGVSPGRYRTERRIAAARNFLRFSIMTNQEIAVHLGFADEFHFSKRFKQITGVSPREYRRQKIAHHSQASARIESPPPPPILGETQNS